MIDEILRLDGLIEAKRPGSESGTSALSTARSSYRSLFEAFRDVSSPFRARECLETPSQAWSESSISSRPKPDRHHVVVSF